MTQTGLHIIDRCVKRATSSEELQQCGILATEPGTTPYARANKRASLKFNKYCPTTNPTIVQNFAGVDIANVVIPEVQITIQEAAETSLSIPGRTGSCTDAITKSGSAVIRSALSRAIKCQKRLDARSETFGPLDPSCLRGAGATGTRAASTIRKRCRSIPASAQGCSPFPGCLVTAATEVGEKLAADAYSFVETNACGNGVVDSGEQCDDGNSDPTDACTTECTNATCGDDFVETGVEQCDDGNLVDDDCCTERCTPAVCGDGIVAPGCGEECDSPGDPSCVNCKFVPVVCDGSGLVVTVAVRSDLTTPINDPSAPPTSLALASIRFELRSPETLSLPVIPGVDPPIIDPESGAITNVTGLDSVQFLGQWIDSNGNGVADTADVSGFTPGTVPIPPGDTVAIRFQCPAGTSVTAQQFTCTVTGASDYVGNQREKQYVIPCSVSSISNASGAVSSSQP